MLISAQTTICSGHGIASARRHVLSNGMIALILPNPNSPTVAIQGEIAIGAVNEPAEKAGLGVLTAAMLIRGTTKHTFMELVSQTEERGCSVSANGGLHGTGFGAKALKEDFNLVLEILAEMLMQPTFPEKELEKLRGQFLMSLRESEQETRVRVVRATRQVLYPADHPYSRPAYGTIETIQKLERADLVAFHQTYNPALTTIALVGDLDPEATLATLERIFGAWQATAQAVTQELPPVPPLTTISRQDIPMEGKVQADLLWAVHGLARNSPDYYPALVGNMILGRIGMGGRLSENVRQKQGMAYYVFSGLEADKGAGPWTAMAGVNPLNIERAIQAILHEIELFKREGPTDEEISDTKSYLTGISVLGLETNGGLASSLLAIESFGLGLDYIVRYPEIINAITKEEIKAIACKYLSTENYVLAVAGPPNP